jgi:Spy/CpxP family protein refolding chaperone
VAAAPEGAFPAAPRPCKKKPYNALISLVVSTYKKVTEKNRPEFHSPLNLSREQREKMREIRDRFWADTHNLRYDMAEKRIEMRKLFTDPKADDAALMATQKELRDIMLKLMDRKAQMKIEWRKVLKPEQIRMLDHPFHHGYGQGPHFPGPAALPQ